MRTEWDQEAVLVRSGNSESPVNALSSDIIHQGGKTSVTSNLTWRKILEALSLLESQAVAIT